MKTLANTDGMGNCLQQPGQLSNQLHKSMRPDYSHFSNFFYRDKSCCRDNVNRAAGRRAVVMVFASPSGQLYRDTEILPTYRDFAKTHANPDTDGNSPYHRAVSVHCECLRIRSLRKYCMIFADLN